MFEERKENIKGACKQWEKKIFISHFTILPRIIPGLGGTFGGEGREH